MNIQYPREPVTLLDRQRTRGAGSRRGLGAGSAPGHGVFIELFIGC